MASGELDAAVDREIDELFDELVRLLKGPEASEHLARRGINTSLAMTAADGLHAYLRGEKARAADDLGTVAEEIAARMRKEALS